MRVLFIARTYPPIVGGMQKFASDFYNNYKKTGEIDLLANLGGNATLVPFLIKALFTLLFTSRKYDAILLYDAALFVLIPFIRLVSPAKVLVTVNGLDIVYSRFGYQKIMPFFLKRVDRVIAISRHTMEQCRLRGIPPEKLRTIPIGITFSELGACSNKKKEEMLAKFNLPSGRRFLLTVGRLVKRKGHAWFIENVVRRLPDDYIYIVAGDGPELKPLKSLVTKMELDDRVFILGEISEEEKHCLYQASDQFIMPNITQTGDQEGFGIVLLEAGRYGLPVIASRIEGIQDAVLDGESGHLIAEKDANGFIDAILHPDLDRASLSDKVALNYGWENIIGRYYKEFEKMQSDHNPRRWRKI